MYKYIYLDFEMTGLSLKDDPISLGIICDDSIFYAEFNDYDVSKCDDWVNENVIKNLSWNKLDRCVKSVSKHATHHYLMKDNTEEIRDALTLWLETVRDNKNICVVVDCGYFDMAHFCNLFGGSLNLPKFICPVEVDLNNIIAEYKIIHIADAFNISRESLVEESLADIGHRKHNAINDAYVINRVFNRLTSAMNNTEV